MEFGHITYNKPHALQRQVFHSHSSIKKVSPAKAQLLQRQVIQRNHLTLTSEDSFCSIQVFPMSYLYKDQKSTIIQASVDLHIETLLGTAWYIAQKKTKKKNNISIKPMPHFFFKGLSIIIGQ